MSLVEVRHVIGEAIASDSMDPSIGTSAFGYGTSVSTPSIAAL